MRVHCLILVIAMMAVGCAESGPVNRVHVLIAGREMLLAYHCEMQMAGVSTSEEHVTFVSEEHAAATVTKRETPYNSTEWGDMELPLRVAAMPGSDRLRAKMTVQRFRTGNTSFADGQPKREESSGFGPGPSTGPASEMESQLRDAEFIAIVDPSGQLISSDIVGKYWTKRKGELADGVKKGASRAQAEMALRWETPGVFAALEDVTAYLPPEGAGTGQTWTVKRERVLPYHAYGFFMMTQGCSHSQETSTCTLKSIRTRGKNHIAIISIRGQRIPRGADGSTPQRVKYFEVTGELEVNLGTGAVEKLRIVSVPAWVRPKEESFRVKFVENVSLNPIRAS